MFCHSHCHSKKLSFYFSLGILILTIGASLFWRRSFDINRSGITRISTRKNAESNERRLNLPILTKLISGRFDLPKLTRAIFIFSIFSIFFLLLYQSYQQYQSWSQNEVSQYLLPPHQSINYFIFYAIARFFAPYLISLAVAILFLFSAKALNKKYQERFFKPEEPYFGALAIFLVSHPGWLFYVVFIISAYLLIHFYSLLITHYSLQRISLYYLWIPTAIFVIIIQRWLELLPLWSLLKI